MKKALFILNYRAGTHLFLNSCTSRIDGDLFLETDPSGICPMKDLYAESLSPKEDSTYQFNVWCAHIGEWWGKKKSADIPEPYGLDTPAMLDYKYLLSLGEDWKFVYIVRDGRNQIESMRKMKGGYEEALIKEDPKDRFLQLCKGFRNRAQVAIDCARQLPNFRIFKFEDIVADPVSVFTEMFEWCEIPIDVEKVRRNHEASQTGIKTHSSFQDRSFDDRWKKNWTWTEASLFNQIAGPQLEGLGYKLIRWEELPVNWKDKGVVAGGWYRGENCNIFPRKEFLSAERDILQGWLPPKPFITKDMKVATFGSCFAHAIQNYLRDKGFGIRPIYECQITTHADGLVSTFTILQQLEYAYENKQFKEDVWYFKPNLLAKSSEEDRLNTKRYLDETDVFIITLGLSEIWYSKSSGEIFWRAIPTDVYDPNKHAFRLSSVEENIANLTKIVSLIRSKKSDAPIILTLSPINFLATFRPISAITANCVSKAVLRVAIDSVMSSLREDKNLFYWPGFELIKERFADLYHVDGRHILPSAQGEILDLFAKYYLVS